MISGFGWRRYRRGMSYPRPKAQTSGKKFPILGFRRVPAEIQRRRDNDPLSGGEVIPARVFLTDLCPYSVGLFTTVPLAMGEKVNIAIAASRHLYLRGQVVFCAIRTLNTRVIAAENFCYRVHIRFEFEAWEEQVALVRYCHELSLV